MSAELPPVIERELRRWARELSEGDGGLLMVAVGRSAARRRAIEARLGQLLAGWELVPVELEGQGRDPWAASRAGSGTTLVSLAGVFELDDPDATLAALNLGREHLHQGGPSLVVWIGAMENLERLGRKAPDLWSYRRRVGWFLSAADFEGEPVEVDDGEHIGEGLAELRARLERVQPGDPRRVDLLFDLLWYLDTRADHEEQAVALRELWTLATGNPRVIANQSVMAMRLQRCGEALEWASQLGPARSLPATAMVAAAYTARGRFRAAADHYGLCRIHFDPAAIMLPNEPGMWVQLDDLGRASRCCDEAEGLLRTSRRHKTYAASVIIEHRANVASQRLATYDALNLLRRSWLLARLVGKIVNIESITRDVLTAFRRVGLLDDAEQLCMDALVETPSTNEATSLRHQLVEIQACRDLDRARQTRRRALDNLKAQLSTGPAWRRAMVRRDQVELRRLELGDPLDHDELLAELDRLIYDALDQRQYDLAQWGRVQQVELLLDHHQLDRALSIATIALRWSLDHEGPSRHAERHLDLAKIHRAAQDLDAAQSAIDTAEQLLAAEDPLYQPKKTWKQIFVERHHLALARDDPPAALAALERALSIVREAGVRALELELLHHLAELPDHPDTDPAREQAARSALELARDAMLVFEEARALANLALTEANPKRAQRLLEEARFLAPLCPLEPAESRMSAAALRLGPPKPPASTAG